MKYQLTPEIEIELTNLFWDELKHPHSLYKEDIEMNKALLNKANEKFKIEVEKGNIGFYTLLDDDNIVEEIHKYKEKNYNKYDTFLLVGIGGSSLGTIAIKEAILGKLHNELVMKNKRKGYRFYALENIDASYINDVLSLIVPKKTIFNIISKSGKTAETISQFMIIYDILKKNSINPTEHIVITTSPKKGELLEIAKEEGIKYFPIPENVGGRFSVLSAVGLLPSAFLNIDIKKLIEGARNIKSNIENLQPSENPVYLLSLLLFLYDKRFSIKNTVLMSYSENLNGLNMWFRQLWAESLGKKYSETNDIIYAGLNPMPAIGVIDQHSQIQLYNEGPYDKVIIFIEIEDMGEDINIPKIFEEKDTFKKLGGKTINKLFKAEYLGTLKAITENKKPNAIIKIKKLDEHTLGELFFFFEMLTTITGYLYNINPFNQPGVEKGKKYTYEFLEKM